MSDVNAKVRPVALSELAGMSDETRASTLRALVRAADRAPNGELRELDEQIGAFEARFGLDSEAMRRDVANGSRRETADVCEWLMLLRVRERLRATLTTRSG
jgi:hypothetical protein